MKIRKYFEVNKSENTRCIKTHMVRLCPNLGKKSITFNNPFKLREKKRCKFVNYASISRR